MKEKVKKPTWQIHYVSDMVCDECGLAHNDFRSGMCDAHTHGLGKYDHDELQIVVALPPRLAGYILNEVGLRVANGETFKDGDEISGIIRKEDGSPATIKAVKLEKGKLRLLIPDPGYRFPDDPKCEYPYSLQLTDGHRPNRSTLA